MRYLLYIVIIQAGILAGLNTQATGQEVMQELTRAFKNGDASLLSTYFNSTLDVTLPDTDETMSKAHATQVMKSFFKNNPPRSYTENHTGSSREATKYIIGTYKSTKTYKTYVLLKEKEGQYLIVQIQFEEE
jgi:hypothetical protein